MSQNRQLAAIMFTDIVGYTALMGSDEQKAFDLLYKNRQIQKPLIKKFRGKFLKEMGDGMLASFETVSDAVMCAGAIQQAVEAEDELKLKIGIHQGEVVFEDNDVFGDGVNIASRIVAITPTGEIWGSASVQRNVQNKQGIDTDFVREETLKNVKEPVQLYRITLNKPNEPPSVPQLPASRSRISKSVLYGLAALLLILIGYFAISPYLKKGEVKIADVDKSIAVLPFINMSDDPEQAYFTDGITEEILTRLAKIGALRVISRTSSMRYQNSEKTIPEIARELNVSYVVEGSVRKSENKVRITAQLIRAGSDDHLWAETFDRALTDVFEIQSEVAQSIARELQATISPEVTENLNTRPTENMEAYQLYLRGLQVIPDRSAEALQQGKRLFEQAIQLDSSFAQAWGELANVTFLMWGWGVVGDSSKYLSRALELSEKALSLNKNMARPHSVMGAVYSNGFGDHKKGVDAYLQALTIDPNDGTTFQRMSDLLAHTKFKLLAAATGKKAVQIDPFSMVNNFKMIDALIGAKQLDVAWEKIQLFKELFPEADRTINGLTIGYFYSSGRCEELSKMEDVWPGLLPQCYCIANKPDSAQKLLNSMEDEYPLIQAWIDQDIDHMFRIMNETYDKDPAYHYFFIDDPFYDILKRDPRYEQLLKRNPWDSVTEDQMTRFRKLTGI